MRSPFDHIRVERQVGLLPILAGIGILGILAVTVLAGQQTRNQLTLLQHGWDESLQTSRDIEGLLNSYNSALQNAAAAAEPAEIERADSMADAFDHILAMGLSNPVVRQTEVDSLIAQFRTYRDHARGATLALIDGATTDQILPDLTRMVDAHNELSGTLGARTARDKANIIAAYETVAAVNRQATLAIVLALVLVVSMTGWLAFSIAARVKASIDTVGRAASHIAAGDLRAGFDFGSQVQLAPLARPFTEITDYIRTIANAADRLARGDLTVSMVPRSANDEVAINLGQAIADRVAMEKSLRESEEVQQAKRMEAIGRLAGGIAHDFNNLLTAIIGHTAILEDMLGPDHSGHDSLVEVQRASDRAAALTRQLLAYGRKQVLHAKLVDMDTIVTDVIRMLRPMIRADIAIDHETTGDPGSVRIDPTQIEQVILNLVLNARDAMNEGGGTVTLRTRDIDIAERDTGPDRRLSSGRYVVLEVTDTGVGMDRATRERIFEPFFTTKGLAGGAGLGLATVYGIVRQSGGEVEVTSEPGKGTTFLIYLPREPAAEIDCPAKPDEQEPASTTGGEIVLVAEDEPSVRSVIVRGLTQSGYRVIEAANGIEALAAADSHSGHIDILLSDVVMPKMGGPELVRRLIKARPQTRVIFMSGYSEDAVVQPDIFEGGHLFIEKPFAPPALMRVLREALDGRPPVSARSEREQQALAQAS